MRRHSLLAAAAASSVLAVAGALIAGGAAQAATPLPTVTVAVTPRSITVGGTLQSGAVNVVASDTASRKQRACCSMLNAGVSAAEVEAFIRPGGSKDPNCLDKYGSIVFNTEVNPGASTRSTDQPAAGRIPRAVPARRRRPKGTRFFTVTAAVSPAALPTPQATVRSIEFAFRGPTTLKDGELVRFENAGFLVHMDIAFPVKNMKAAKTVVKDLLSGKEKGLEKLVDGAPVTFAGPLSSGAYQQETITAKPGIYVQVCFMETQDGRPHTLLGMERIIKITK